MGYQYLTLQLRSNMISMINTIHITLRDFKNNTSFIGSYISTVHSEIANYNIIETYSKQTSTNRNYPLLF